MKPIPKRLLIHSIVYQEVAQSDGWDDTQAAPVTIDNVRVEPIKTFNYSSDATTNAVSHIVFVDRVHSSSFPSFKTDSDITFDGSDYKISKVKTFYGFENTPHHYELELV